MLLGKAHSLMALASLAKVMHCLCHLLQSWGLLTMYFPSFVMLTPTAESMMQLPLTEDNVSYAPA